MEPLIDQPNLTVISEATVHQIVFDENKVAVAVKVYFNDKLHTFKCRKEIIVCAGAFQSPQLLMLSGIGPADHLKQFNIPLVFDNPNVGNNLVSKFSFILFLFYFLF